MIEAIVSAAIAGLTGVIAVHTRMGSRISDVDRRIDQVELRIAESYVKREELAVALQKMESHMIRIEDKLDALVMRRRSDDPHP